tara:strand:- start:204 stop:443 length:240 start_codon:yes stop_codon:yes gene_type:complete
MNSNQIHSLAITIVLINIYLLASLISMNFNPIEWYWVVQMIVLFSVISTLNSKKGKQKSKQNLPNYNIEERVEGYREYK